MPYIRRPVEDTVFFLIERRAKADRLYGDSVAQLEGLAEAIHRATSASHRQQLIKNYNQLFDIVYPDYYSEFLRRA